MAEAAARSEGVVDLDELRESGLTRQSASRRVEKGWLHRMHQGVYAVGHDNVSLNGRFIAAVKACGPDACLSHRAAAAYMGFMDWREREIEVTVPRGRFPQHGGIHVHRSSIIERSDLMLRGGILVTKPGWTVVAMAAVLDRQGLRSAARRALALRLTSLRELYGVLGRVGPQRGTRVLREILARGAVPTRSELEDVVYDLIVGGGFEPPDVNVPLRLDGRIVIPDFRWPRQKLIVEADGAKWHDDALSRAGDAERQQLLERHGETVLRVRWDEALVRPASACARFEAAGAPRP